MSLHHRPGFHRYHGFRCRRPATQHTVSRHEESFFLVAIAKDEAKCSERPFASKFCQMTPCENRVLEFFVNLLADSSFRGLSTQAAVSVQQQSCTPARIEKPSGHQKLAQGSRTAGKSRISVIAGTKMLRDARTAEMRKLRRGKPQ